MERSMEVADTVRFSLSDWTKRLTKGSIKISGGLAVHIAHFV